MNNWRECKNILCVRLDNMGDLLMTSPALAALKESFACKITVLTSSMGGKMAEHIPVIDEILIWDVPWVKNDILNTEGIFELVSLLKQKKFDASVIFTVFSQNPLPAAMVLMMAEIPERLAYCRENPYHLLTVWVPDKEPYSFIQHQVERDLSLVKNVGAVTINDRLRILLTPGVKKSVDRKLAGLGIATGSQWLVLHPGVSEEKRKYPAGHWISIGKKLTTQYHLQVLITGSAAEAPLTAQISDGIGTGAFSCADLFDLEEFIFLISLSPLIISVNTSAVHIAAATDTKVIVLYALTNPQHTPWKAKGMILPFSVPEYLRSRNTILEFVQQKYFTEPLAFPTPDFVAEAAFELLNSHEPPAIPFLVMNDEKITAEASAHEI